MIDLFKIEKTKTDLQGEIAVLKTELRNYTEIVTNALVDAAVGETGEGYISALETAAGALSRAFSAAVVSGTASDSFTPWVMAQIGRALVENGESIWYRKAGNNLIRVDNYGIQPSGLYQLNFNDGMNPLVVERGRVFHVRWNIDISSNRGIGPLTTARTLKSMASKLEGSITDELNAAVGYLLPIPTDGDDKTIKQLKMDIAGLKGKIAVIETARTGWGQGPQQGTAEYRLDRLGPFIPPTNVNLFTITRDAVLNACGYPVSLANDGEGTGQREAWRRYLHGTVAPLGRLVIQEAERIGMNIEIDWKQLFASDISGRARAFQSLVGGGMSIEAAATASGLLNIEE